MKMLKDLSYATNKICFTQNFLKYFLTEGLKIHNLNGIFLADEQEDPEKQAFSHEQESFEKKNGQT